MKILFHAGNILKTNTQANNRVAVFSRVQLPQTQLPMFKQNTQFHIAYVYGIKLSQLIRPQVSFEIAKQEFYSEYWSAYTSAKQAYENSFKHANPYVLEQQYPEQIKLAKQNEFRNLFAKTTKDYLRYGLGEDGEKQVATLAWLKRIVETDDVFVTRVIERLQTNTAIVPAPASLVESVSNDFYGLYEFDLVNGLSTVLAKQEANQRVSEIAKQVGIHTQNRMEHHTKNCLKQLDETLKGSTQTQNLFANNSFATNNPFVFVGNRYEEIRQQIATDVYEDFYGVVLKETQEKVFGKKFAETAYDIGNKGYSVPYILDEYINEFKLLYENNLATEKLQQDMVVLQRAQNNQNHFVFDFAGKQAEIRFYQMTSEFLYESIALKERTKAVKNVIGDIASLLYEQNEAYLSKERMSNVWKVVENFVPNCTPDFLRQIDNHVANLMTKNEFEFEDFSDILEEYIVKNRDELQINGKVDVETYAYRVAQAVMMQVEEQENAENSYYNIYLKNTLQIKRQIAAKRLSEWAKIANDFAVMGESLTTQIEHIKLLDETLVSNQEKQLIQYHNLLGEQSDKLNKQMDVVLAKYNTDSEVLGEFVVDYVNSIRSELVEIANPMVRNYTVHAFAKPLVQNNVIETTDELKKSVEILLKREHPEYIKIEKDLAVFKPIVNTSEKTMLPTLQPKMGAPKNLKGKKQQKITTKQPNLDKKLLETKNNQDENQKVVETETKPQSESLQQKQEPKPTVEKQHEKVVAPKVETQELQPNIAKDKSVDEQLVDMKSVHMETIDTDAKQYAELEQTKQKLEEFETLSRKEKVQLLTEILTGTKYEHMLQDTNHLEEQLSVAKSLLQDDTGNLLTKYGKSSTEEKIAFVVLSAKQLEMGDQEIAPQKTTQEVVGKKYDLSDAKEVTSCKNDLFWKMQLRATKQNVSLVKTLENSDLTEFKQLAPIIKLFEISASDNVDMSNVKISGKQLNNQQLARVTILKLKDGKINDPVSVSHVNHMLANTSAYAKTDEYKQTLDTLFADKTIKNGLQNGTLALDTLIEQETQEGGKLQGLMDYFVKKTSPTMPKLVKLEEDEIAKKQENTNITI